MFLIFLIDKSIDVQLLYCLLTEMLCNTVKLNNQDSVLICRGQCRIPKYI